MDVGSENIGLAEARRWRRLERRASPSSKTKLEYELGFTPGDRPRDDGSWMRCAPLRVLSILVVIVWGGTRPARPPPVARAAPLFDHELGHALHPPALPPRRSGLDPASHSWTPRAASLDSRSPASPPRSESVAARTLHRCAHPRGIGARTHEGSVRARTRAASNRNVPFTHGSNTGGLQLPRDSSQDSNHRTQRRNSARMGVNPSLAPDRRAHRRRMTSVPRTWSPHRHPKATVSQGEPTERDAARAPKPVSPRRLQIRTRRVHLRTQYNCQGN